MSPILKDELEQQLIEAKKDSEKVYEIQCKTKRITLRSKSRWYDEGEQKIKIIFQLKNATLQA